MRSSNHLPIRLPVYPHEKWLSLNELDEPNKLDELNELCCAENKLNELE